MLSRRMLLYQVAQLRLIFWAISGMYLLGNHILFKSLISLCFQHMMLPSSCAKQKDDDEMIFLFLLFKDPWPNHQPTIHPWLPLEQQCSFFWQSLVAQDGHWSNCGNAQAPSNLYLKIQPLPRKKRDNLAGWAGRLDVKRVQSNLQRVETRCSR